MCSRQTSELGFSDEWLANDGFVNVISQGSDGVSKVVDFNGRSERGAWTRFKTLRMDHLGMMGKNPLIPVYDVYKTHAALLTDLPSHESLARTTTEEADAVHEAPAAIVEAVHSVQDALTAV